jgi:proteic killer suppression protein
MLFLNFGIDEKYKLKVKILDRKLRKVISDARKLQKEFGKRNAELIVQRYNELVNIPNLGLMVKYRVGRCHLLTGNLKGKYALDLEHPLRMIIEPVFESENLEINEVVEVSIIIMEDYHG